MRMLKLDVEALVVESFQTVPAADGRGTVHGAGDRAFEAFGADPGVHRAVPQRRVGVPHPELRQLVRRRNRRGAGGAHGVIRRAVGS